MTEITKAESFLNTAQQARAEALTRAGSILGTRGTLGGVIKVGDTLDIHALAHYIITGGDPWAQAAVASEDEPE